MWHAAHTLMCINIYRTLDSRNAHNVEPGSRKSMDLHQLHTNCATTGLATLLWPILLCLFMLDAFLFCFLQGIIYWNAVDDAGHVTHWEVCILNMSVQNSSSFLLQACCFMNPLLLVPDERDYIFTHVSVSALASSFTLVAFIVNETLNIINWHKLVLWMIFCSSCFYAKLHPTTLCVFKCLLHKRPNCVIGLDASATCKYI